MSNSKSKRGDNTIAVNRRARFEYEIENTWEAGLSLLGWEAKALRAGKASIAESYVMIKNNEAWLYGSDIRPLQTASTHVSPEPGRDRRLLLHREELNKLIGAVERKGYALIPMKMYWKGHLAKLQIGLGKGKKAHDKRADKKDKDWARDKQRIMKKNLQ